MGRHKSLLLNEHAQVILSVRWDGGGSVLIAGRELEVTNIQKRDHRLCFSRIVLFFSANQDKRPLRMPRNGRLFVFDGAPGPIRTADTRFRRAVLYPLSYEGMWDILLTST